MILGIDVDNVLCDYNGALAEIVAKHRGISVKDLPECDSWGFTNWGFQTDADFKVFHRQLMSHSGSIQIKPKPHAAEVVKRLIKGGHHIRIVTQRASTTILGKEFGRQIAKDTVDWLHLHEIEFHDICFLDDKTHAYADLYCEDAPHHIESFIAAGKDYLIFDYLFNRGLDGKRVNGWLELKHTSMEEIRKVDPTTGAEKGTKLERHDLIPGPALQRLAIHFGVGSQKYAEHNWRRGYPWSWSFSALCRHLWAFWRGEDIDAETGSRHITAVVWHAMALDTFMDEHPDKDDRYKPKSKEAELKKPEMSRHVEPMIEIMRENAEHVCYTDVVKTISAILSDILGLNDPFNGTNSREAARRWAKWEMTMDSRTDTLFHIRRVNELLINCAMELMQRAKVHDSTKLVSPEVEYFDKFNEKLATLTYNSPEYKDNLKDLDPALQHHYAHNTHHPQHYKNGVNDMDLFDLLEMLVDWKASGERQLNGNILQSLEANKERYGIKPQMANILKNTVDRYYR